MKKQILRIFNALTLWLLFTSSPALAQNNLLPTNVSNFNIGTVGNGHSSNNLSNAGVTTNYSYVSWENGLLADGATQHYAVGTNARYYGNGHNNIIGDFGLFSMGDHTTGNGNYMIVNGSTSSNKKVWEYTVQNVAPGVIYQFQAYVTCLFMTPYGTTPTNDYIPKLQLRINDQNVGPVFSVPWTNGGQWVSWTQEWTAESNTTSAKITIIDNCTNDNGNDFGIDDIVFKMKDGYSLTANNFTVQYCGEITPIVLQQPEHYTMTCPSGGNSAPPMQVRIRKDSAHEWGTSIEHTTHYGTAYVEGNTIYYTPYPGYYGPDDLQYQILRFGLESHKTITINIGNVPTDCTPQGLPTNNLLCINDLSSFNPSATWASNGSNITQSGWLYKKIGVTDWQESYTFQSWVQQWGETGEYSIRFFAQNSCTGNGFVYSEPYNFNICDVPEITGPYVTSICTGSGEPFFDIDWNYNTGVGTWQYKRNNGNWTDFGCSWDDFDLQEGDQVRYQVTYDACSGNPLTSPQPPINVVSGPEFDPTNVPVLWVETGYCPGSTVNLPQIQTSWYNDFGMNVTPHWYYVIANPSGSPEYQQINGNTIVLNNGSVSVTPGLLNTECGPLPTTFSPAFDLIVWDEPTIEGLENLPDSLGPVCSGTALSSILPALSPGGHFLVNGYSWEISSGESPSGFSSNLPTQLSSGDNRKWLRYHVQKDPECDEHSDVFSDPIRVWVGAAPTLSPSQIEPFGTVCTGTTVSSLVDVQTDWNLFYDEESFERWEVLLNGTWTEFTQFELIHDGCQVRYHAHNQCGDAIAVVSEPIHVTTGPTFNDPEEPLGFANYYCDGAPLYLPEVGYDAHGMSVSLRWEYDDGTGPHPLSQQQIVNENWNGYEVYCVLESDCGGIRYPTPFTLTVVGQPVVEDISMEGTFFCVNDAMVLDTIVNWHRCTPSNQSSWQYAPVGSQNAYIDFDPDNGIPEAGEFNINFHAVANECGYENSYNYPIQVTINATPAIEDPEQPFVLEHFCEGDLLQLPDLNVTGYVESSGWMISEDSDPYGNYMEVPNGYVLTHGVDDGRYIKYYAMGCYTLVYFPDFPVEIHVDEKPWVEYSIADRLCKGQSLTPQWENSNGYPVTQIEWRINDTISGVSFDDPTNYTFNTQGNYLIYYRVGNDCGWSKYMGPLSLTVTAGPEFDNSTLPNEPQYVCEGTTVEDFLLQSGITVPDLLDPSITHYPLGWFINYQSVDLSTIIGTGVHDAELCYGVSGDCSEIPVYSRGIRLYVYGRPAVTQMPTMDWEFCEDDEVQLPDPDINFNNGEGHVQGYWQMQSPDGSWGDLPTNWGAIHDGMQIRYHLEHTVCPNLSNDSGELTISVFSAPIINDEDLPTNNLVTICFGSSLGIDEPGVQPEPNESGWQVSANGTDWSTQLEGHTFNPDYVDDFFNGKYLRYHAESTRCPNLEDNSMVYTIQLINSPSIDDVNWPDLVQYCSGGSLDIQVPSGLPGEWQVSANGTNWDTQLEGHVFDENHIDDFFNGKLLRYYVHTLCGDAESKVLTLKLMAAVNMPIIGETQVAMMNSFWPGIYDYHIDSTNLVHPVQWSIEGANWQLRPLGMARCLVYVNSTGTAVLHARIMNELCSNEVEVLLPINSTHFGVEDNTALEVTVYPNPTRNTVTIEAEGIEKIRLTNMMGQVLEMREYGGQDSVVLNLDGYTPSVYLLEVKTVNGVAKKRLILYR